MANELQQKPKFDIFQKALFCTLASSTNFALRVIKVGQLPCIFKEVRTLVENEATWNDIKKMSKNFL